MILVSQPFRRVCFVGSPGAGKSTCAAAFFAYLKIQRAYYDFPHNVELLVEYVKQWTWDGRTPKDHDQHYIFGKQSYKEECILRGGNIVITDSPLCLSSYYGKNLATINEIDKMVLNHEKFYPALHIFVPRDSDKQWVGSGRWHGQDETKEIEVGILECLNRLKIPYITLNQALRNLEVWMPHLKRTLLGPPDQSDRDTLRELCIP